MKTATVNFTKYNVDVFERGLGVNINSLSKDSLTAALSHSLGYVDYTNPNVASKLKETMEKDIQPGKEVEVIFESYNVSAFESGLDVSIDDLTEDELSKALTHALGYVDYSHPNIAAEILEEMK